MDQKFTRGVWKSVKEDMSGFHIWCFTCKEKTYKRNLRSLHLNHEVDWIRDSDGHRYSFMSDGSVPICH